MTETNGKHDEPEETPGGLGGHSQRTDSGLTEIKEQRMIGRAIAEGWLGNRWPTDITVDKLSEIAQERGLTAKEKAMATIHRDMSNKDPRPAQNAVGNLLRAEAQNQADEHKLIPDVRELRLTVDPNQRRERLAALDDRLGLGGVVDEIPAPSTASDSPAAQRNGHAGNGQSGPGGVPPADND